MHRDLPSAEVLKIKFNFYFKKSSTNKLCGVITQFNF